MGAVKDMEEVLSKVNALGEPNQYYKQSSASGNSDPTEGGSCEPSEYRRASPTEPKSVFYGLIKRLDDDSIGASPKEKFELLPEQNNHQESKPLNAGADPSNLKPLGLRYDELGYSTNSIVYQRWEELRKSSFLIEDPVLRAQREKQIKKYCQKLRVEEQRRKDNETFKNELLFQKRFVRLLNKKQEYLDVSDILSRIDLSEEIEPYTKIPQMSRIFSAGCPNSAEGCNYTSRVWNCVNCMMTVRYGFDEHIYCFCGRSPIYSCRLNCNEDTHGDAFTAFDSKEEVLSLCEGAYPAEDEVNVLLLGELGSGKSTLITSIINHLKYNSLEEAQHNGLFSLQSADTSSSTKHCRSYKLTHDNKTYRFIDTPGIEPNSSNSKKREILQLIFSYVSQFNHIHSICVLINSVYSDVDTLYEFCIQDGLALFPLGTDASLIFVLTHSRKTDFIPGVVLKDLKEVMNSKDPKIFTGVKIQHKNVFCVDNEVFQKRENSDGKVCLTVEDIRKLSSNWDHSRGESLRMLNKLKNFNPIDIKDSIIVNDTKRLIDANVKALITGCMEYEKMIYVLETYFQDFDTDEPEKSLRLVQKHTKLIRKYERYQKFYQISGRSLNVAIKKKILSHILPSDSKEKSTEDKEHLENELKEVVQCCGKITSFSSATTLVSFEDITRLELRKLVDIERKNMKSCSDRTHAKLVSRLRQLLKDYDSCFRATHNELGKQFQYESQNGTSDFLFQTARELFQSLQDVYRLEACGSLIKGLAFKEKRADENGMINLSSVRAIYSGLTTSYFETARVSTMKSKPHKKEYYSWPYHDPVWSDSDSEDGLPTGAPKNVPKKPDQVDVSDEVERFFLDPKIPSSDSSEAELDLQDKLISSWNKPEESVLNLENLHVKLTNEPTQAGDPDVKTAIDLKDGTADSNYSHSLQFNSQDDNTDVMKSVKDKFTDMFVHQTMPETSIHNNLYQISQPSSRNDLPQLRDETGSWFGPQYAHETIPLDYSNFNETHNYPASIGYNSASRCYTNEAITNQGLAYAEYSEAAIQPKAYNQDIDTDFYSPCPTTKASPSGRYATYSPRIGHYSPCRIPCFSESTSPVPSYRQLIEDFEEHSRYLDSVKLIEELQMVHRESKNSDIPTNLHHTNSTEASFHGSNQKGFVNNQMASVEQPQPYNEQLQTYDSYTVDYQRVPEVVTELPPNCNPDLIAYPTFSQPMLYHVYRQFEDMYKQRNISIVQSQNSDFG